MISRSLTPGVCLVALALTAPAGATSVAPMSLEEVAAQAAVVQRARVASRKAAWGEHQGHPAIVTTLRFDRVTALKGSAIHTITLFGGEIGERSMRLLGQPELRVGEEVFLFFEKDHTALPCPFVGIWRGAYPVRKGQVHMQGRPIKDIVNGLPVVVTDNERGMSAAAFHAEVKRAIARAARPVEAPRAETPIRLAPAVKVPTPTVIQPAPQVETPAPTPIEETASGTDEEALANSKQPLTPEQRDDLPLGFRRPGRFGTARSSATLPGGRGAEPPAQRGGAVAKRATRGTVGAEPPQTKMEESR